MYEYMVRILKIQFIYVWKSSRISDINIQHDPHETKNGDLKLNCKKKDLLSQSHHTTI